MFAVWEPILVTDWMRPGAPVLGLIPDLRAHQYWDRGHLLAQRLAADAREPQPEQDCCTRKGILWDLAAVYPPGLQWTDHVPPAVFFNGPVVKVRDEFERAVTASRTGQRGSANSVRTASSN